MTAWLQSLLSGFIGVIVGCALTCWLTYHFQKKLLQQQAEAQEKSHQELLRILKVGGEEAKKQAEAISGAMWNVAGNTIPRTTIDLRDRPQR